jgi:hypothetical protein
MPPGAIDLSDVFLVLVSLVLIVIGGAITIGIAVAAFVLIGGFIASFRETPRTTAVLLLVVVVVGGGLGLGVVKW